MKTYGRQVGKLCVVWMEPFSSQGPRAWRGVERPRGSTRRGRHELLSFVVQTMGTPRNPPKSALGYPQRTITEWIGMFQFEEYGARKADVRQGEAMRHFNIFLARYSGLPSQVSKYSHVVTAPVGELNAGHFRDFLAWIVTQEPHKGVGKEWYTPTLAKFIEWLEGNNAIAAGQRQEFFSALKTPDAQH